MVAAIGREMHPGLMAFEAVGLAGAAGVFIAGWTTTNPTLYRAGLALQVITPNWSRWKVTLSAGLLTTILSCFPVFFMRLLDYVAIYGLILMPIGAIVLAEHWILPLFKIEQFQTEKSKKLFNGRALIVWMGTLLVCFFLPIHLFFRWLPGYILALFAYVLFHVIRKKEGVKPADAKETM